MTIDTYEKHVEAGSLAIESPSSAKGKECVLVGTERQVERQQHHVAHCGFEIVGVTMGPLLCADASDLFGAEDESAQDRMMSSLVSVLGPEQKVAFIYEGGGRTKLQWHIVVEASSAESAKQADDRLRNVRHALMTVLESRTTFFRFRPISEDTAARIGAVRGKWMGLIQPQGTHVKSARGPVGFRQSTGPVAETDTAVCLPHYVHERARAFSSIVTLLMSSHVAMRVTIALEACRLNLAQEHAIKAALEVILDRSADSELPEHLENAAKVWLKTLDGCRMTCSVSSSLPISESFLKMLAGEIYNGPVDVCCRRPADVRSKPKRFSKKIGESTDSADLPAPDQREGRRVDTDFRTLPKGVLDLRNCIPSMVSLPPLFPQPEALVRHGMRKFFNRERLVLSKDGSLMGCIQEGRTEQKVRLCRKERSRHLYILGATGTGKSTVLYNLVMQDIHHGEGVCLVDPHGDLYQQVCESIPAHRADDVVLLDPCARELAVGINLLECTGPYRDMQTNFVINEVLAILERLYDMKQCGGPMFELYFRGALQLVMADPNNIGTLVDMSAVFEHKEYRAAMIKKAGATLLTDFWKMAMRAGGEATLANIAPYIVSKLNSFTHNPLLRPI
ncbi:MAG: DUF87 domain-containing protein, partial [bacterium]